MTKALQWNKEWKWKDSGKYMCQCILISKGNNINENYKLGLKYMTIQVPKVVNEVIKYSYLYSLEVK